MSCGVGHRRGLDPTLLWLWCRPAAAALIGPLAWEPPYAVGVALRKQKKTKKRKEGRKVEKRGPGGESQGQEGLGLDKLFREKEEGWGQRSGSGSRPAWAVARPEMGI